MAIRRGLAEYIRSSWSQPLAPLLPPFQAPLRPTNTPTRAVCQPSFLCGTSMSGWCAHRRHPNGLRWCKCKGGGLGTMSTGVQPSFLCHEQLLSQREYWTARAYNSGSPPLARTAARARGMCTRKTASAAPIHSALACTELTGALAGRAHRRNRKPHLTRTRGHRQIATHQ